MVIKKHGTNDMIVNISYITAYYRKDILTQIYCKLKRFITFSTYRFFHFPASEWVQSQKLQLGFLVQMNEHSSALFTLEKVTHLHFAKFLSCSLEGAHTIYRFSGLSSAQSIAISQPMPSLLFYK